MSDAVKYFAVSSENSLVLDSDAFSIQRLLASEIYDVFELL